MTGGHASRRAPRTAPTTSASASSPWPCATSPSRGTRRRGWKTWPASSGIAKGSVFQHFGSQGRPVPGRLPPGGGGPAALPGRARRGPSRGFFATLRYWLERTEHLLREDFVSYRLTLIGNYGSDLVLRREINRYLAGEDALRDGGLRAARVWPGASCDATWTPSSCPRCSSGRWSASRTRSWPRSCSPASCAGVPAIPRLKRASPSSCASWRPRSGAGQRSEAAPVGAPRAAPLRRGGQGPAILETWEGSSPRAGTGVLEDRDPRSLGRSRGRSSRPRRRRTYCVIGGQGVNAYADPVVSLDLDLVVATGISMGSKGSSPPASRSSSPHSLNLSRAGSDLRVQFQRDPRYEAFLATPARRRSWACTCRSRASRTSSRERSGPLSIRLVGRANGRKTWPTSRDSSKRPEPSLTCAREILDRLLEGSRFQPRKARGSMSCLRTE